MDWNILEKHFSAPRLGRYSAARGGNTARAALDYACNLQLAEAMMPLLNTVEVALRNAINVRLTAKYHRSDWWQAWANDPAFCWQNKEVASVIARLRSRHEPQTPDKVIAELTFGFWSSLFNVQFQAILWKELRLVFARCPKPQRQRRSISSALNQIRHLRNRIFHHEPLLWLRPSLSELHTTGTRIIHWIDPGLACWLAEFDRIPAVWAGWRKN